LYAKSSRIHDRVKGYNAAIADMKIKGKVLYYPDSYRHKEDIWNSIKDTLKKSRSKIAFMCWNDVDAINVLELLKQQDISVPEKVGVMGVDDLTIGEHISPKLTTFKQPFSEIADLAINRLCDENKEEKYIEVYAEIIERESI